MSASTLNLAGAGQSFGPDLVLVCPQGGTGVPQFQDQKTGKTTPIYDPRLRAIAEKACGSGNLGGSAQSTVMAVNQTGATIYVGFTGSISWTASTGCSPSAGGTEQIAAGATCTATVGPVGSSRFCANTSPGALNCNNAQNLHVTMIETTFQSDGAVAYDLSVIPLNPVPPGYGYCTDCTWNGNTNDPTCNPPPTNAKSYCKGTGAVAYNLPVMLSCSGQPTYTCRGPLSTQGPGGVTYGTPYPNRCGNPNATCACGAQGCPANNCVAAYFYPMFYPPESSYQPNATCFAGSTLVMTFLSGQ